MPKTLSTSNSRRWPWALILCVILLLIVEGFVRLNLSRILTLSDGIVAVRKQTLKNPESKYYDAIIVGDSRVLGINTKYISDQVSKALGTQQIFYNYAIPNHGIRAYYLFLKKFLQTHQPPKYIIFSSAPLGISGEWTVSEAQDSSTEIHYLTQLYSNRELRGVFPFWQRMGFNLNKLEQLSKLIAYRLRIKVGLGNPEQYFTKDKLEAIPRQEVEYNGAQIIVRNAPVGIDEMRRSPYYQFPIFPDAETVKWYGEFFALAQANNITVLICNMPIYQEILANRQVDGSNERYINVVDGWMREFDNLEILGSLLSAYELKYFSDWHHLNLEGIRQHSFVLADQLIEYLSKRE